MSSHADHLEHTPFEPFGDRQYLNRYVRSTPSILFRAHSPHSAGSTTATCVTSTAALYHQDHNEPYDDDVLDYDMEVAMESLKRHVTKWARGKDDNFMSWTSSLLFALQHAIRRDDMESLPNARQVKISILFTFSLPSGCFMPSVALLDAHGAQYSPFMQRKNYHGEYLSQGSLAVPKGAMTTITLADLLASGLYQLYPDFELDKRRLCNRVTELRERFLGQQHGLIPNEVRLVRGIAEACCENSAFRFVLFAGLLALKSRELLDPCIQDVYGELRQCEILCFRCWQFLEQANNIQHGGR